LKKPYTIVIIKKWNPCQVIPIKIDIVGGGLSGLSTAITIREQNPHINVVVHEKNKEIGYNREGRRCGEGYCLYPEIIRWQPLEKSIFTVIKKQDFTVGEKTYHMPAPSVVSSVIILNKQEFIAQLGRQAATLGVEIRTDDSITSIESMNGDYLVDASGCPSVIRRQLGIPTKHYGICYQETLQDANVFSSDTMRFFFLESLGYYWMFPRNPQKKEINLGVGVPNTHPGHLKEMLEQFKEKHNIKGTVNYVTGGLVPAGMQRPLMHKNILFVGDAGTGAFPITGEGNPSALISGEIAGRCLATNTAARYPHDVRCAKLQWDLVGKTFTITAFILRKVGVKAYLTALDSFIRYIYFPMVY
jgi:flavin-dependent dehydrogenase